MLSELVRRLANVLQDRSPGYVQLFETVLAQIAGLNDPACIGLLLPFFDDNEQHSEMMFSIVHTIEMFEDETYVREITKHLDSFWTRSPKWAVTVHMRILNSPTTLATYTAQINSLSKAQRQTVRQVLEAVRRKDTRFDTSCTPLLTLL